jgi:hypothetical protein
MKKIDLIMGKTGCIIKMVDEILDKRDKKRYHSS